MSSEHQKRHLCAPLPAPARRGVGCGDRRQSARWLEVERQYALGREGPKQHLHPMLEVFDP